MLKKLQKEHFYNITLFKIIIIILLILVSLTMIFYFEFLMEIHVVYTHFFYIPIVLAGFWWGKRSTWVALLFGLVMMASTPLNLSANFFEHLSRSIMFLIVSWIVGSIRENGLNYEVELNEQKDFTESLVQNLIVPTFVIDSKHNVIIWNKTCEELTGIIASEVIGTESHWKAFYEMQRPCISDMIVDGTDDELSNYYKTFSKSNLVSDGLHGEGWYNNLGGKDRFIYFDAAPMRNKQGEIIAVIETIHDITTLKIVEEQLREKEQMFRGTFEQAAVGIVHVGLDGRWLRVNERFCEITGYNHDELLNLNFKALNHPDDHNNDFENVQSLLLGDIDTFTIEKRCIRKDGLIVWANYTASLVREIVGEPKYYIWVIQDISKRKAAEQALKEKSSNMEKELQLASSIQYKLLPKELPNLNDIAFVWEFRPSVFVAGDMFNVFRINDDHIGFYILDVMGHGIPAALKAITLSYMLKPTSNLSSFLETDKLDQGQSINLPSNILNYLNEQFPFGDENQSFFTIFYGVLNTKTLELTYSRGGHCCPVVITLEGEVKELTDGGAAIGLSNKSNYKNFTFKFNKGDKMFLYTDGITEAKNSQKEPFSKKRFIEFLVNNRNIDISKLIGDLIEEVKRYNQNRAMEDDLTILGLEIKGE